MNNSTPWDPDNLKPWENDDVEPSDILELNDWKITLPVDGEDSDSEPDGAKENELSDSYENAYFYAGEDGGVVFNVPPIGDDTAFTPNTTNPRNELREMLRAGDTSIPTNPGDDEPSNENNWVFGSAPRNQENPPGGVNGELTATLAVNRVAEFSDNDNNQARVIIGQILAGEVGDDNREVPIKIVYQKLPDEDKGTVYLLAEDVEDENFGRYDLFLDSEDSSDNSDGIELGEQFSYNVKAEGNEITVTLSRDGKPDLTHTIDYSGKGFDDTDAFMYFKAGAYVQNNSDTEGDYTQVTFYEVDNTHDSPDDDSDSDDLTAQSIQSGTLDSSADLFGQSIQSETLDSKEIYRETLTGASGVETRYNFDDVSNSTKDGGQDVIRNFEPDLDIIDFSDIGGITGLDTDGGKTEMGEIRLAYSSSSDRTYLRTDQSEFEAFIEGGDYRSSLTAENFVFAENTDIM